MSELRELADRCVQASGPSRHLDTQIFILLDPDAQHIVGHKPGPFPQEAIYGPRSTFWDWATDESKDPPEFAAIPAYTASVDAALTLVPEGWGFAVVTNDDRTHTARASCWTEGNRCFRCEHAITPALALCAAVLRSIVSERNER